VNDGLANTIKSGNLNGARILFTRGVHPTTLDLVKKINDLSFELSKKSNEITYKSEVNKLKFFFKNQIQI
jgi:hypothetical protein